MLLIVVIEIILLMTILYFTYNDKGTKILYILLVIAVLLNLIVELIWG